jgi:hypothetical protein
VAKATDEQLRRILTMLASDDVSQLTAQAVIGARVRTGLLWLWDMSSTRAARHVEAIESPLAKSEAYANLFRARRAEHFLEKARRVARSISPENGHRDENECARQSAAFVFIASVSRSDEDINQIIRAVLSTCRGHTGLKACIEYARLSGLDLDAHNVFVQFREITDPLQIILGTCSIAAALGAVVSSEQVEKAESLVQLFKDEGIKSRCFSELAKAHAALGDFGRARFMADSIVDGCGCGDEKIYALIEIAKMSKLPGDFAALKKAIGSGDVSMSAIRGQLSGMIFLGDYDRVRRILSSPIRSATDGLLRYDLALIGLDLARSTMEGDDLLLVENLIGGVDDLDRKYLLFSKVARTASEILWPSA